MKHFEEMGSQKNSPIKIVLLGDEGAGKTGMKELLFGIEGFIVGSGVPKL